MKGRKTNKTKRVKTFEQFVKFLQEECISADKYMDGKYDRKIYNWFSLPKAQKGKNV